jgi:DNA invertase Pin-like site-specific DNA recombinase
VPGVTLLLQVFSLRFPAIRRWRSPSLHLFAEFERGIISERVNAVLARARANGTKLGRRRVEPAVEARILELKASGDGMLKIGRKLGIGTSVVQRVFKQVPTTPELKGYL